MVKTLDIEYMKDLKVIPTTLPGVRAHTVSTGERPESSPPHHFAESPVNHGRNGGEDHLQASSPVFTTSPSADFVLSLGSGQYPFRRWMPNLGRVITSRFALDTETTAIDDDRPARIPSLVLGMAFDGRQGWFITADDMPGFLAAHPGNSLIFHNAAFDLAVLQATHDRRNCPVDIYARVEAGRVADTQILARLVALATVGHSARNQCSLDYCSQKYLSLALPKDLKTASDDSVRLTFGRYLERPFETIPAEYLRYAAADPVATWLLFERLKGEVPVIKAGAGRAFGYASPGWLDAQWRRHGPLTHDIQLKASIALDRISRTGVLIDQSRRDEKVAALHQQTEAARRELALAGLPVEGKGASAALRKRIERLAAGDKNIPIMRTETGQVATDEEQLKELSAYDPVLGVILRFRHAAKLHGTYLKKMGGRVHGRFQHLMNTGRTSCGGGFNLQNLPKELDASDQEATIRSCFVPEPGHVFVVVDYAQIELVTLGWAFKHQFGTGDSLHRIVSEGRDMHRLIAAHVLGKAPAAVTKAERNAAKPVSLGRPGGLGWRTIQKQAKNVYGADLTEEEVRSRMQAYETLCPELTEHLKSRVNTGLEIARALALTPVAYNVAIGSRQGRPSAADEAPAGWLGGMLLKVLESQSPCTSGSTEMGLAPRPYTEAEKNFLWAAASRIPVNELDDRCRDDLRERRPSPRLRNAVAAIYSREPVITATGRLRANASYSACRNGIMQGLAADGAIYALWGLMRAGYKIVNFIHDEVIVEVPEDDNLPAKVADIKRLMIAGMQTVVPGANVRVETSIRRSFSKSDTIEPVSPVHGGASTGGMSSG